MLITMFAVLQNGAIWRMNLTEWHYALYRGKSKSERLHTVYFGNQDFKGYEESAPLQLSISNNPRRLHKNCTLCTRLPACHTVSEWIKAQICWHWLYSQNEATRSRLLWSSVRITCIFKYLYTCICTRSSRLFVCPVLSVFFIVFTSIYSFFVFVFIFCIRVLPEWRINILLIKKMCCIIKGWTVFQALC